MSYSQKVKEELCAVRTGRSSCKGCAAALLYGMLLFGRGESAESGSDILLTTENRLAALLFAQNAAELTGGIVTVTQPDLTARRLPGRRQLYHVTMEDEGDRSRLLNLFFLQGEVDRTGIRPKLVRRECCACAFLRGAFLTGGTMANPEKEYHLEFSAGEESLCEDLIELLAFYELDFHKSLRGKNVLVYTKESNRIEDLLARMGAVKSSLALMNLKIEKELRNKANRVTNCETANIDKTVNASMEQIRSIRFLQKSGELDSLPGTLKEAAVLRLANPDASLRELCELAGGQISRSGLNHRLKKLQELAKAQMPEQEEEDF